jgi:hypothetical protein
MSCRTQHMILGLVVFAGANLASALALVAPNTQALAQFSARPDALLSVDMNRSAVVEKISSTWEKEIPSAQMVVIKGKLGALRADQLLAASMASSLDGVLEIVHTASESQTAWTPALGSAHTYFAAQSAIKNAAESAIPAAQNSAFLSQISQNLTADSAKALGDANADLVYTPLVPCRLFDTRAGLSSALGTVGGTFSNQQTKTISPAGACGIPSSGVASLFLSFHAYNNNPSTLGVIGFMKPAAPFSALAATWTGANWATGTFITQTNPNGSFDAFVGNGQTMTADMIVDVMGYFRAPQGTIAGGTGDITDVLTAAGSGLTGGVTSGAANLSIASTYKLPQACANGQVPKYNTATLVWECANDLQGTGAGGAGTVTNIATGVGLSGGPITSTGTINLASTQLLPITACADSQTLIWNTTTNKWICAAWNSGGGATSAFVNGGNSFGTSAVLGTNDAQLLQIKSGGSINLSSAGAGAATQITSDGNISFYVNRTSARIGGSVGIMQIIDEQGSANFISGLYTNQYNSLTTGQTIAGGGSPTNSCLNQAQTAANTSCRNETGANYATVSGGKGNSALQEGTTVAGGDSNRALGLYSVVSGGYANTANSARSVVAGGYQNTAGSSINGAGPDSFVAGGYLNYTQGNASFAAGNRAKAFHDHSFVFGGNPAGDTNSAGVSTLTGFFKNGYYLFGGSTAGTKCVYVPDNDNGWQCVSDRNTKTNIAQLNGKSILEKVVAMPVSSWSFKGGESFKQIGPMAQDFFSAFKLGSSDKSISAMNMGGVALAAIQGLNQKLIAEAKAKDATLSAQAEKLTALERELATIKKKLGL